MAELEFKPKHSHSLLPWSPSNMLERDKGGTSKTQGKGKEQRQSCQRTERGVSPGSGEASGQREALWECHGRWAWREIRVHSTMESEERVFGRGVMHQTTFQNFLGPTKLGDSSANHDRKWWIGNVQEDEKEWIWERCRSQSSEWRGRGGKHLGWLSFWFDQLSA